MRKLMEYKIIAGRTVEIKRSYLSVRPGEKRKRGTRKAGSSSLKKIRANEMNAARELARLINMNFPAGSGFVSLKYDNARLPEDFEAAKAFAEKYVRKLRRAYRRETGHNPKLILVNANWSPRRQAPARLHHHLILPADGIELARRLWPGGGFSLECLDSRADHSALAEYLIENLHGMPNEKHWHPSRNLDKPIYTEPVPVDDIEGVKAEKESVIKEHRVSTDEEGHVTGAYLRCVLPEAPRVRGGQIFLTRRKRREREPERDYLKGIRDADE